MNSIKDGSELLSAHIEALGIRPIEWARRHDIPQPMLSLWLSRKRRPGLDSAFAIERATDGAVPASSWTEHERSVDRRPPSRRGIHRDNR